LEDEDKTGKDWERDELDAIVVDYFAMLGDELSRRPYVKSHRRRMLAERIERSHGSIEFKHQNISAILQEVGLPWIWGYKPKQNYQASLGDAIDRYLSSFGSSAIEKDIRYDQEPSRILDANEAPGVFVETPPALRPRERPRHLARLIGKFDPVERDLRNRALGKAGEAFVFEVERLRLERVDRSDLARKVRWVAEEDGDGAGYDILSFDQKGTERLIEVKTTNGALRTPFFLTRNECETAAECADTWQLYRVHLFAQKASICTIKPPLETGLNLRPEVWRASLI
jgi:hypothetical protein